MAQPTAKSDREIRLERLLTEALDWVDDYGARMSGSARLGDRIRTELNQEDPEPED